MILQKHISCLEVLLQASVQNLRKTNDRFVKPILAADLLWLSVSSSNERKINRNNTLVVLLLLNSYFCNGL